MCRYSTKSNLVADQGSIGAAKSSATMAWSFGTSGPDFFGLVCNLAALTPKRSPGCQLMGLGGQTGHYHSKLSYLKYP